MDAIFTREWRSYFLSPIGYIFSGVFIALCSFFFVNGALMYQSADISVVFSNINIVYLFLVSILTMGLFSSERSRRTDMLLLTAPVSVTKIVTAKYLAAMWVFLTTLILTLIYPIIFRIFGAPPMSEIIGAYVGFILLWGAFIAIGLFISTLTESQMIAAVMTFGILLVVFYMNALAAGIKNPTLQSIVRWFSLMDRYAEFESGVLNLVNVVYYISFIVVFLFLSVQVLCRRRVSDRKLKINNAIVTAAVIAGVILVNAIVSAVAEKMPMKFDMTNDGVYNYSEETKQVLAEAEGEINIYALYPDSASGELVQAVRETLDNYRQMGKNITVTYKDPYEDPAFAGKYGSDVAIGSVIVEQGDRFKVIPLEKICLENKYSGSVS
ncbi:MAG: Gldg family protein, partial [Clostridia bacterium]|nr:Gldg family protein [Clostridia bacterium]